MLDNMKPQVTSAYQEIYSTLYILNIIVVPWRKYSINITIQISAQRRRKEASLGVTDYERTCSKSGDLPIITTWHQFLVPQRKNVAIDYVATVCT